MTSSSPVIRDHLSSLGIMQQGVRCKNPNSQLLRKAMENVQDPSRMLGGIAAQRMAKILEAASGGRVQVLRDWAGPFS